MAARKRWRRCSPPPLPMVLRSGPGTGGGGEWQQGPQKEPRSNRGAGASDHQRRERPPTQIGKSARLVPRDIEGGPQGYAYRVGALLQPRRGRRGGLSVLFLLQSVWGVRTGLGLCEEAQGLRRGPDP